MPTKHCYVLNRFFLLEESVFYPFFHMSKILPNMVKVNVLHLINFSDFRTWIP